jgi:hypothetical protein
VNDGTRGRLEPDGELHGTAESRPWSISSVRDANGELHVADYWIDEQARLNVPQPSPTDADLAEWQRRFEERNTPAARAAHRRREMRRLLTRRTRWRLWWHGRIDAVAIWLAGMGRAGRALARGLWRVTGLWL